MKRATEETKQGYINQIAEAHPIYTPESGFAQKCLKSLKSLSCDTLMYLHWFAEIAPKKEARR